MPDQMGQPGLLDHYISGQIGPLAIGSATRRQPAEAAYDGNQMSGPMQVQARGAPMLGLQPAAVAPAQTTQVVGARSGGYSTIPIAPMAPAPTSWPVAQSPARLGMTAQAPVAPTRAVTVPPVAQTPAGPQPVQVPINPATMSNGATPGTPAYERTAAALTPGVVKGADGITLGMPPAAAAPAAPAQAKGQTFDDYLKDRFMNANSAEAQKFYGAMIQHTFSPVYQAQKQFAAEGQTIHDNNMRAILQATNLADKDRQAAIDNEMKRHRELLLPLFPGAAQLGLMDPGG